MDPRFITKRIHAYLDYPVALMLLVAPFGLGLGASHPFAPWLSVATGVAALLLTLLTDHHLGVFRVLPYWLHVVADAVVGVTFLAAPLLLGFAGLDLAYFLFNGAVVATVVALNKPELKPEGAADTTPTLRAA